MEYKSTPYPFEELLSNIVDNRGKTCPVVADGLPLIATNCVKNDTLYPVFEKVRYVDKNTYDTWFRGHPEPGDMIFVCKGAPGNICWTPDPVNFCIAQDMVAIRANRNIIVPKYLFALLRSSKTKAQILNMHVGTMIPHFKKGDFKNLHFDIPDDKGVQESIGDMYFRLTEKIELNRQTNETLDQMAQALFKSWFVNFDPVIDNALEAGNTIPDELKERAAGRQQQLAKPDHQPLPDDIRQLFPGEFELTDELSWVPMGWNPGTLADIASFGKEKVHVSKLILENYVSTENMNAGKSGINTASGIPKTGQVPSFAVGETLISNIRPYFKKIWFASFGGGRSNDVLGFQAKNQAANEFLFNLLYRDTFFDYMTATAKGTKMPRGDKEAIMRWPSVIPPPKLMEEFSDIVKPSYLANNLRSAQSRVLSETRDTLLPKLISGELRLPSNALPDVEQQLDDATP
ncbi:MAG: type I restriction enzyme S subunit [Oleiphilaceae bacterium]|jgi:type I restriction enzyme S subunit